MISVGPCKKLQGICYGLGQSVSLLRPYCCEREGSLRRECEGKNGGCYASDDVVLIESIHHHDADNLVTVMLLR